MNKKIFWIVVLISLGVGVFFMTQKTATTPPIKQPPIATTTTYTNTTYGFTLTLPQSWNGYTVTTGTLPFGYTVTLRHPLWTEENQYMDIPILVYPIAQWRQWESNNFEGYPTAAPIGPTERGRNERYVFATAPRYNYSFKTGWETVDEIIKSLEGF
jgi:hypothetical protein